MTSISFPDDTEASHPRRSTLDVLLSTTYSRSQLYLSRQLAQLHPEMTMPMFSGELITSSDPPQSQSEVDSAAAHCPSRQWDDEVKIRVAPRARFFVPVRWEATKQNAYFRRQKYKSVSFPFELVFVWSNQLMEEGRGNGNRCVSLLSYQIFVYE